MIFSTKKMVLLGIVCFTGLISIMSLRGMEDVVKNLEENMTMKNWIEVETLIKDNKNNPELSSRLLEIIKKAFFDEINKSESLENIEALCKILIKNSKLAPNELVDAFNIIDEKISQSFGSSTYELNLSISKYLNSIGPKTLNFGQNPVIISAASEAAFSISSESSSASCIACSQIAPAATSSSSSQSSIEASSSSTSEPTSMLPTTSNEVAASSPSSSTAASTSLQPIIELHEEQAAQITSTAESSSSTQQTEATNQPMVTASSSTPASSSSSSTGLQPITEIDEQQPAQEISLSGSSTSTQITEPTRQSEVLTAQASVTTTPQTKQRCNCVALLWAFIMLLFPQKCG